MLLVAGAGKQPHLRVIAPDRPRRMQHRCRVVHGEDDGRRMLGVNAAQQLAACGVAVMQAARMRLQLRHQLRIVVDGDIGNALPVQDLGQHAADAKQEIEEAQRKRVRIVIEETSEVYDSFQGTKPIPLPPGNVVYSEGFTDLWNKIVEKEEEDALCENLLKFIQRLFYRINELGIYKRE